ncbi:DUF4232 domain-containing protein [Streptomyces sp. 8N616]|uniref:DUF4232 domain-containing protein n=1 Tax=Streptomyces sp. 8N616 TaxID=3457414 RepID=UPI003FD58547
MTKKVFHMRAIRSRVRTFAGAGLLVSAALLATACQPFGAESAGSGDSSSASSAPVVSGKDTKSGSSATDKSRSTAETSTTKGKGTEDGAGSGYDTGNGEREQVGQTCGANDISWSTREESRAGGYILIIAKAKPGITCELPAGLPTVAFGSDGTQAGNAEQAVGEQITLSEGTTAYAGVNPKTTKGNGGKELDSIIVAVGSDDPNPVSLPVGTMTVDEPIVTNWHTSAADAVPFDGGTDE